MNLIEQYYGECDAHRNTGQKIERVFQENQIRLLVDRHQGINGKYLLDYLMKASLTSANPALGEIFLTSHWMNVGKGKAAKWEQVGTTVWSYQWMIKMASQQNDYQGFEVVCEEKTLPRMVEKVGDNGVVGFELNKYETLVATCTLHRKSLKAPVVFEATFGEYCQTKKDGTLNKMWKTKPSFMLKKCAVAGALRWAFPEIFGGIYLQEEIGNQEATADIITTIEESEERAKIEVEKQKAIDHAAINSLESAKIIETIQRLMSLHVGNASREEKIQYMKVHLKVDSFKELKKFGPEHLKALAEKLEQGMPKDTPKGEDEQMAESLRRIGEQQERKNEK